MDHVKRFISVKAATVYASLCEATIRRMLEDGRLTRCQPLGTDRVLIDVCELDRVVRGQPVAVTG
jgi:hypothetical protein